MSRAEVDFREMREVENRSVGISVIGWGMQSRKKLVKKPLGGWEVRTIFLAEADTM
jgi:hypothetical protein